MAKIFPGWWQVGIAVLNQATATGIIIMSFSIVAMALEQAFATKRETVMLTMTAYYIVTGIAHPIIGTALDRYSTRKIMFAGVLLLAGGLLACSFATSVLQVILIYALVLSVAQPATGPVAYTVHLSKWFVRQRGRAMAIAALGISLGGLIFPPLFQHFVGAYGWRTAFQILAGIVFVLMTPLVGLLAVDKPSDRGLHPDGDSTTPPVVATANDAHFAGTGAVLRNANFWLITGVIAILIAGAGGFLSNMVPLAVSKGFTAAQGAAAVSFIGVGLAASMILYALVGDRISPRVGLAGCLVAFALSALCYMNAGIFLILVAGTTLQGVSLGFMQPLWSVVVAQVFGPANAGRVFGLMTLFLTVPTLFSHPVMGRLYDKTGTYDYGFMFFIAVGLVGTLLVTRIRTEPAPLPTPVAS